MRRATMLGAMVLLLAALGAGGEDPTPAEWRGLYDGPGVFTERLARTPREWAQIQALFGVRDAPAIDFTTHMVAAVGIGMRRTGGFSVHILGAEERDGVLYVRYRERAPRPDQFVTQALTAPYHVRVLPRLDAPTVRFERVSQPEG